MKAIIHALTDMFPGCGLAFILVEGEQMSYVSNIEPDDLSSIFRQASERLDQSTPEGTTRQ